ncbi:hypothetical protein GALMADRAFT_238041 [Galerina marginata CBS 339.88]|uniref:Probable RNA polymerase II nuclear localization protein SLC7A6OS n=1 Tax=Galerina marginata (strain CBS 339.88) TaxID=685588 RepID=A0A067THD0_GALM3|nr:hypothetical protein GALMADRAFT_238041 [Galerina marginata CBS 339.88]
MQVDYPNPNAQTSQTATATESKSYTILRIKRKRNEEPLDALVIESRVRRKKSRGGIGLFQYAQTVENDVWEDENRQKDIQDKISRLAREDATKLEWKASVPPTNEAPLSPARIPTNLKDDTPRRYTVVENNQVKPPSRRYPTAPPKVLSARELENRRRASDFKMYDAIPTSGEQPMEQDQPSEMDKFLPMLSDYLKLHDSETSAGLQVSDQFSGLTNTSNRLSSSENDYVWDVFYHRPATLSEWNEVANVGTVSGLPPSFGDGYDSASDSDEEVDEADEDSNAEEYYKNDYPEEENSDEWHEGSDYDEVVNYADDGEDQSDI